MIHFGIDISNADFDVHVAGQVRKFKQNHTGYQKFVDWARKQAGDEPMVFVMEATGAYHLRLAHFLYLTGLEVAVVNPKRICYHAKANLTRVRNDASSARNIWDFAVKNQLKGGWKPLPDEITKLKFWVNRINQLGKEITAINNRIHALKLNVCSMEEERQALEQDLSDRNRKRAEACQKADELSDYHKPIKKLLLSIPGLGPASVRTLIVLFCGNYQIQSARKALALVGMALRRMDSGTSVHYRPKLSKVGYAPVRHMLYMAALSAKKYNPACKALYDRLVKDGKPKKQALIAVACKLLRQAFGVLRSNIPFSVELSLNNFAR